MRRRWGLRIVIWALLGLVPAAQSGGDSIPTEQEAFDEFARGWVSEMAAFLKKQRQSSRSLTPVTPGKPEIYTYRDFGGDYAIETRETGNAAAPYVGIINYTENTYECRGPTREDCKLIESSPIIEIFPFKDGKWQY